MASLRDKFEIIKNSPNKKSEPRYVLNISMDSNDGDYIRDTVSFSESNWKLLPEFFFLMLSYAAQGYSGKFSHGNNWGDYYGHHWEENKHGLSEELRTWADDYSIMQYSDWGSCHSFSQLYLYYYDEDNKQFEVKIPSIDNEFNTEEEMIKAIKDAYDSYNKECDNCYDVDTSEDI